MPRPARENPGRYDNLDYDNDNGAESIPLGIWEIEYSVPGVSGVSGSFRARFPGTASLVAPATPAYTATMRHPIGPKVDCYRSQIKEGESYPKLHPHLRDLAAGSDPAAG